PDHHELLQPDGHELLRPGDRQLLRDSECQLLHRPGGELLRRTGRQLLLGAGGRHLPPAAATATGDRGPHPAGGHAVLFAGRGLSVTVRIWRTGGVSYQMMAHHPAAYTAGSPGLSPAATHSAQARIRSYSASM